ncbi:unnamed protein product [Phytophthora fragariaefolia]|uniref:Unnamed protein product n=1 Tax=Phytophthora fragariaefolia TaxID=1490495 RepID=A0A9W7D9Q0_9STRA|nr:unnamed protein product [Phytophthora fragariaefolia]
METKPPTFEGYDLAVDDKVVGLELGQYVRKNAATWYETYMTSSMTTKTWSAMKVSTEKNFKEPNFQQKLRNELLNFNQRRSCHGYVAKFQEKLRLVLLGPVFAMEIFLKGLKNTNLRKHILRKQPTTLEDVIAEGFSEVELGRIEETKRKQNTAKDTTGGPSKTKFNSRTSATPPRMTNQNGEKKSAINVVKAFINRKITGSSSPRSDGRSGGISPKAIQRDKCALVEKKLSVEADVEGAVMKSDVESEAVFIHVGDSPEHPIMNLDCTVRLNEREVAATGFVDSGASINAVTPEFVK